MIPTNSHGGGKRQSSGRRYGWTPLAGKGRYTEIDKFLLHIDHEYQRDNINDNRVADIARDWTWSACGCILVARRADGTFWVYDGQHRVLAARKREDVQDLPCLVFDISATREEARAFVDTNTVRGPMRAFEKFKARLVAEDPNALRVAAALEQIGYTIGGGNNKQVSCIEAIERAFRKNPDEANTALEVCGAIYGSEPIRANVFKGLFYLEGYLRRQHEGSITRADIRTKLMSVKPAELLDKANEATQFYGKTGEKVYAAGLANFVNKKKHSNRISNPMT